MDINIPLFPHQLLFVLSVATLLTKVELTSTTKTNGVQSVVMDGASRKRTSSADSSATLLRPRPGGVLTLVKDRDRFYLTMLHATEMSQASTSVITVDGLVIAAVTRRMWE